MLVMKFFIILHMFWTIHRSPVRCVINACGSKVWSNYQWCVIFCKFNHSSSQESRNGWTPRLFIRLPFALDFGAHVWNQIPEFVNRSIPVASPSSTGEDILRLPPWKKFKSFKVIRQCQTKSAWKLTEQLWSLLKLPMPGSRHSFTKTWQQRQK